MRSFRYLLGQFVRPAARSAAVEVLLSVDQLPGVGWKLLQTRSWRTGTNGHIDEARRAGKAGHVTAWRVFRQQPSEQWAWVQVLPVVTAQDALSAFPQIRSTMVPSGRAKVRGEREIFIDRMPGAARQIAYEQSTSGRSGDGVALTLIVAVGRYVVVISDSGPVGSCTWDFVTTAAARQIANLSARVLG